MQYVKDGDERVQVVLDRFGGLDRSSPLLSEASRELRNFRCMADGSLKRREGAVPILTMSEDIRGVTTLHRNGVDEVYLVAGNTVYFLSKQPDGYVTNPIGEITTSSGKVEFCCLDRVLILMDGVEFWTLLPEGIELTEAYIPLYGKDWTEYSSTSNVVFEQPNLLSRRIRIQYKLTKEASTVNVSAVKPISCDYVLINGVPPAKFSHNVSTSTVALDKKYPLGTIVEVFLTLPEGANADRSLLTCARHAASIGDANNGLTVLYGIEGEQHFWISHPIEKENRNLVKGIYPNACMMYFLEENRHTIGDGVHQVTGICPHYDRWLVFTSKGTWMADGSTNQDGGLKFMAVNTTQGCSFLGAFGVLGNTPLSVCQGRVLRWNSDTDERDECNAGSISAPVEALLREQFRENVVLYTDVLRNELWLYLPGEDARILVWQADFGSWTSFDGFTPSGILMLDGNVAFHQDQTLYRLDAAATADTNAQGQRIGIDAEYASSYLDFGQATRTKRVCDANVVAQCGNGEISLTLQGVDGEVSEVSMTGDGQEISVMRRRTHGGRFRFLRVGVRASHDGVMRLLGIRLTARH